MSKPSEFCAKCNKQSGGEEGPTTTLMRCARCKLASYCSRECQKADWELHKSRCNKPAATFLNLAVSPLTVTIKAPRDFPSNFSPSSASLCSEGKLKMSSSSLFTWGINHVRCSSYGDKIAFSCFTCPFGMDPEIHTRKKIFLFGPFFYPTLSFKRVASFLVKCWTTNCILDWETPIPCWQP
jgi:hypothetical protein